MTCVWQQAALGHSSQDESVLRTAASTAALRLARRHDSALPAETYLRLALAMQVDWAQLCAALTSDIDRAVWELLGACSNIYMDVCVKSP